MIGQTVSHYRIVEKLGEGAMGVVYLAEDTHLGRQVAIKFLSDAQHHTYRARFLREARAVSTLSHRHIAVVHDYGETPEGQPFIVMEYIKGKTLSDLLHASSLTIKQSVEVVAAVAEALGAAHARGIIHRDIKPSNVLVDKEGEVKVLDFGLVKQLHDEHAPGVGPDANTLLARTSSNIIVGTPLYLSPEQAMGGDVDARSDLFSLGALLYECLAGKPAFSGKSVIEIGAQILHFNPVRPSSINKRVNPELDRISLKALAKKPEARYQTASEMVADLEAALKALDNDDSHRTQRLVASKQSQSSALKSFSNSLRRPRLSISFFVLTLAVVVGGVWATFQWRKTSATVPFQNMQLTRLTNTGKSLQAAISPDGKYFAQVVSEAGQESVVVNHTATESAVVIVPPSAVRYHGLTFSHDGNYIYYVSSEKNDLGLLSRVPVLGGAIKRIMSQVDSPISLSPDDKQLTFVRYSKSEGEYSLMVAQADGTAERTLATRKNGADFSLFGPDWSPDSKTIICAEGSFVGGYHMNVVAVDVANATEKIVPLPSWYGVLRALWVEDGRGLIIAAAEESVSQIQLWYASYPSGETHRITNDSSDYFSISLTADSKKLVAIQLSKRKTIWVAPSGDANRATQVASAVGNTYGLAWTPDARITYSTMASGKLDLWSIRSDGTGRKQLTVDAGSNYHPTVSSDGRYIFFSSNRTGTFNIWRMDEDGSNPKQLTTGESDFFPDPSPDGQWVIYQNGGANFGKPTIWKVSVDGGESIQLTDKNSSVPAVSPDGKSIACRYWDEASNSQTVAIIGIAGGTPIHTFKIPIHLWQRIRWTPDSTALTYVDIHGGVSNVWKQPLDGRASQLTFFTSDQIFSYDWSHDGKQLACERGLETTDVVLMNSKR